MFYNFNQRVNIMLKLDFGWFTKLILPFGRKLKSLIFRI